MNFHRAILAYADEAEQPFLGVGYVVPKRWTAYHVAKRLADAYAIVEATCAAPGPRAFGSAWPEYEREYQDLVDEDARRNHEAAFERGLSRRLRPSAIEIEMAEEACEWPAQFLAAGSPELDALNLWTLANARGLNVERILHRRRLNADAMIEAIQNRAAQPAAVVTDPQALQAAMRGVLATANVMLEQAEDALRKAAEAHRAAEALLAAKASDKAKRKALARLAKAKRAVRQALADERFARKLAVDRLRKIVNIEGLIARPPGERIRRSEVMPGRVFTQRYYDERRKAAACAIASALDARNVYVR